jgi:uncharacterized protein (TIGR03083 family)
VRACFELAAGAFAGLVGAVRFDDWDRPALGQWSVRDLVGHTSRALSTIEAYLGQPVGPGAPVIGDAAGYWRAARAGLADPAAVARRGQEAGAALGPDPAATVGSLAARVTAVVAGTVDDAVLATPVGPVTLAAYLPTRTFELTVHSLDLARATGSDVPAALAGPIADCLAMAAQMAGAGPDPAAVLSALTGRGPLPRGFSVL